MLEYLAMVAVAVPFPVCERLRPVLWVRAFVCTLLLSWVIPSGFANAQSAQRPGDAADASSSVHGTVLNRLTREPISGALVYSADERYATLTDNRGRFAFQFPRQESTPGPGSASTPDSRMFQLLLNRRSPHAFLARKPGYLDDPSRSREVADPGRSEITILLDPESRIVGHVNIPEGNLRIRLELFRHQTDGGRELWVPAGTFRTWENGEFRFFNLQPGTYRLVTDEQVDRDSLTSNTAEHLFGFPPVFYSGAPDFASASNIQLAAGATVQAEISLTRRAYYSIKIPVANATASQRLYVQVYPLGNPSPGYTLGYNPGEQMIQGFLPDGNYTVKAETSASPGSTGILNLAVNGAPSEGVALSLVPNAEVAVNVKEEFKSGQSVFQEGAQEPADRLPDAARVPQANIEVMLTPTEEFGPERAYASHPAEGGPEHALSIQNVPPGRYTVAVETGLGYAAVVVAGETDLLHQPLVIGAGGSNSTIEVILRDDGAEMAGTVESSTKAGGTSHDNDEDAATSYVYFVPVSGSTGQFRETACDDDGSFALQQLPPGTYRVLAFDREKEGLANPDEETMREVESKGQLIQLMPNEQEHLRLKIVSEAESQ